MERLTVAVKDACEAQCQPEDIQRAIRLGLLDGGRLVWAEHAERGFLVEHDCEDCDECALREAIGTDGPITKTCPGCCEHCPPHAPPPGVPDLSAKPAGARA